MIGQIMLGLVSCFILTLCCLNKKNKKNKIIKVNTISVYPNPYFNPHLNPPNYNKNISNNPIFMNNNQIVYEQNPPPEYSEN